MNLRYHTESKEWTYEAKAGSKISFGFNKISLPSTPSNTLLHDTQPFSLRNKLGNIGPLVGIMTSFSKNMSLAGNGSLFKALQTEITKRNGMTVVFPPETIVKDGLTGVTFLPDTQKWIPIKTPLPHLVFNRVPYRKAEQQLAFKDAVNYLIALGIPFFNPAFINKNKLYHLFASHDQLRKLMPESISVKSLNQLDAFLDKHKGIYLKPSSSSKGIGIFRIRQRNWQIEFESHSHRHHYNGITEFWNAKSKQLLKYDYIAQKEVRPAAIDGKRFDFRVHAHDGQNGYEVTGIGIRQSEKQDLTTHIPNGGSLLPYITVKNPRHDAFFAWAVREIGMMLTEELGYFGEFSLDAGLTEDGKYVIYEVNSKPMSFDEPQIEEKRIIALVDLFFRKTGFSD
ncbi:YheC/YheD family endospore coat-associated protein [Mesobacillus jeotgali]|uniref:YheC/YheD family endospore coat-associated protein n=1 Tax=Mesobacillus jeotgali TaxID=129985 RepID=UPI0009A7A4F2|nr:YheC/YheD family protein [Mesobacillus jeotgali]